MMYQSKINPNVYTVTCVNLLPIVRFSNYFEVACGAYWGWRFIPDYEFILIVEGRFIYKTLKQEFVAVKGDIICIPPLVKHYFGHIQEYGRGVISCIHTEPVDFSAISKLCEVTPNPQTITHPSDYDFFHTQFACAAQNIQLADDYSAQLLVSIVKTIWLGLMKCWVELPVVSSPPTAVNRMCIFIKADIKKKLSRNDLADAFGYTPEYVNYLFKKELGVTPSQFINREKVLYAFMLIHQNGMSVKQAAAQVGFDDQYHFSKIFKKITTRSPSEYKR